VIFEVIRDISRPQMCETCRGEHVTHPLRLGPNAMMWPTVLCSNRECVAFGHEMAIVRHTPEEQASMQAAIRGRT
jgi:hypothetical protein